jgi:PhnB protein
VRHGSNPARAIERKEPEMPKPARNYRPEGVTAITAYLTIKGAAKAIDFYKQAFGAQELTRHASPDGMIGHASLRIGDSIVYLCDEMMGAKSATSLGGSPVTLHMYVPDCDATWKQAIAAGGKEIMPLSDQFWGDRYGLLADPFGHLWGITTQKEELTPQELGQRVKAAFQGQR